MRANDGLIDRGREAEIVGVDDEAARLFPISDFRFPI
jgi:hypothetical protein